MCYATRTSHPMLRYAACSRTTPPRFGTCLCTCTSFGTAPSRCVCNQVWLLEVSVNRYGLLLLWYCFNVWGLGCSGRGTFSTFGQLEHTCTSCSCACTDLHCDGYARAPHGLGSRHVWPSGDHYYDPALHARRQEAHHHPKGVGEAHGRARQAVKRDYHRWVGHCVGLRE